MAALLKALSQQWVRLLHASYAHITSAYACMLTRVLKVYHGLASAELFAR